MTRAVASRIPSRPPATRPRVALALGGGGARGLAHIAMIEALDEMGVRPAVIAGTSIGAIFGAAMASGLSAREIRAHADEALSQRFDLVRQLFSARADPMQKLFNLLPMRSALLKPEALLDLLLPSRIAKTFADLAFPLHIVATDYYAQAPAIITSGSVRSAVAASMALPAIFQPVTVGDRIMMDGGLVNPLPFDVVEGQADITIAIDVSGGVGEEDDRAAKRAYPSAFEALIASSQILQRSIIIEKLKAATPDIYIDVAVDRFHLLEFYSYEAILAAAAPAKASLKRQLARVLGAEPVAAEAPVAVVRGAGAEPTAAKTKARGKQRRLSLKQPRRRKTR